MRSPYVSFRFLLLCKFSHDCVLRVTTILWMSNVDIPPLSLNFCFCRLDMLDFMGESFWSLLSVREEEELEKVTSDDEFEVRTVVL